MKRFAVVVVALAGLVGGMTPAVPSRAAGGSPDTGADNMLIGQDAFGGTPTFVDRGVRMRAICNLGRQDVVVDGIEPEDPGIIVLGGSSDHLILDVEDARNPVKLGDEITFYPGYGALLALSTSPYVQKVVIKG